MGLTEGHLLNDEGGAWEPIGGWPDKDNLSTYPRPVCCENRIPNHGLKARYSRKEYLAILDVFHQAIDDYKEAVETLKKLESMGPELTTVINRYRAYIKEVQQQIILVSWILSSVVEVRDDES